MHMQRLIFPPPGVQPKGAPTTQVDVAGMRQLASELGEAMYSVSSLTEDFNYTLTEAVLSAVQAVYDEAKASAAANTCAGVKVLETTAHIHLLKAENAGRRLRLEAEVRAREEMQKRMAEVVSSENEIIADINGYCSGSGGGGKKKGKKSHKKKH